MSYSPITKPEITSGTLIDNRYIIERLLGQGGLGRTYLAFDSRRFNEPCVLKEFAPVGTGLGGLEKCRDLFRREAKILHQLEHPQIPRFLACFEGDNRLFLVQEFVNGKNYSALLGERQQHGLTFAEDEVIKWLKNLLPVLEYVHQHNIIHRDISPDNIMLPQGKDMPVLIDFGVGKQIADIGHASGPEGASFVGKVSLVGKVGYAPREQISLGVCSPSSDLYALGVTAIVLMTGREPSTLMNQYSLEWRWREYTNVSDAFAQVLDKMLADTPRVRYQTAIDILNSLENLGRSPAFLQTPASSAPTRVFVSSSDRSVTPRPQENSSFPQMKARSVSSTNRDFYPPNSTNQDFYPQNSTNQDFYPPNSTNQDFYPPNSTNQDLYQRNSTNQDFYPQNPTNQDFYPPNSTNQDLYQRNSTNQDFYPQTPTNQDFYPPNSTNQDFYPQTPTNQRFYPEQEHSSNSYLDANFIQRCQKNLAYHIGPMASLIVEDMLAENQDYSPQQFVELLANEIPDSQAAIEFVRSLFNSNF